MALTISEAADSKGISRNAVWLAINRGQFTTRKTSGGMWLIEEDQRWEAYHPKPYPRPRRPAGKSDRAEGGE